MPLSLMLGSLICTRKKELTEVHKRVLMKMIQGKLEILQLSIPFKVTKDAIEDWLSHMCQNKAGERSLS